MGTAEAWQDLSSLCQQDVVLASTVKGLLLT
jgi:hypothetical protein